MDIQTEVQKIHHQFGVTEKANYEIQKLFDKLILEDRAEQLRLGGVVGRSELLHKLLQHLSDEDELLPNRTHEQIIEDFKKLV